MTTPLALSQSDATREYLRQGRHHLVRARDLLQRQAPDYKAAAAHVDVCYSASLRALTTWHCVPMPEEADVRALGRSAMQFASILRTFVRRALAVLPVIRTVEGKERLGVHDREGVEAGWYTARNLYHAVVGELPAGVWPETEDEAEAAVRHEFGASSSEGARRPPLRPQRTTPTPRLPWTTR